VQVKVSAKAQNSLQPQYVPAPCVSAVLYWD